MEQTGTIAPATVRLSQLPMATQEQRAAVWRAVAETGDVFQGPGGLWMLTSAEAVHYAHRNPDLFSSTILQTVARDLPVRTVPGCIDPPEHVKFRRVLDPMLAPRVVNAMEDELRVQVRELVTRFAGRGSCDAMRELAALYPTSVFLTVFGLPLSDRDQLIAWTQTMIEKSPQLKSGGEELYAEASWNLYRYIERYVEEKRSQPSDDMLGRILALEGDEAWPMEDIVGLCILFAMAGLDTVTGAIGFMLLHLAQNAELRRQVVADRSLVNPLIEEVLRLEPPAYVFPRITTQDVEVCGVPIPAGSVVMLCLASVNREAGIYEHPDEIDLAQADRGHLTFGGGVHRCLGSHLARRELRLVAEEFLDLVPEFELDPDYEPEVVWPSGTLHLKSLPLLFPVPGGAGQ